MNTTKPLKQLIAEFLGNQDVQPNSRATYGRSLNCMVQWMVRNSVDVQNPKKVDLIKYKNYLTTCGKSIRTAHIYLTAMRRFFAYLEDMEYCKNISAGIKSPKMHHRFVKGYLSTKQVGELLTTPDKSVLIGKRDYAILKLMVHTGVRCTEVARLRVEDIYPEDGHYYIRVLRKGRTEREDINITNDVFDSINDYLVALNSVHAYVFVNVDCKQVHNLTGRSIGGIVNKYLHALGIKSKTITPHSLRHSAAINALKLGMSIYEVMTMLGHTSLKTTQIYLKAIEAETAKNNAAVLALGDEYTKAEENAKNKRFNTVSLIPCE